MKHNEVICGSYIGSECLKMNCPALDKMDQDNYCKDCPIYIGCSGCLRLEECSYRAREDEIDFDSLAEEN